MEFAAKHITTRNKNLAQLKKPGTRIRDVEGWNIKVADIAMPVHREYQIETIYGLLVSIKMLNAHHYGDTAPPNKEPNKDKKDARGTYRKPKNPNHKSATNRISVSTSRIGKS